MAWSLRWRSLRDGVWMLVVLVLLSMLVTIHLGHRLPWMKETALTLDTKPLETKSEHVVLPRNIQRMDNSSIENRLENTVRLFSEGKELLKIETKKGRQLSADHPQSALGNEENRIKSSRSNSTAPKGQGHLEPSVVDFQEVLEFVQKVEAPSLPPSGHANSVLVEGPLSSIKQHFPLIESAFHKYGVDSTYVAWDGPSSQPGLERDTEEDTWSVLMCLNTTMDGSACVVSARHSMIKDYQKTNVVPGFVPSPHRACHVDHQRDSRPGKWYGLDLHCFPIPSSGNDTRIEPQKPTLDGVCQNSSGLWIASVDEKGSMFNKYLTCGQNDSHADIRIDDATSLNGAIAVPFPNDLFLINGREPLLWQAHVLVTSLSPLRAYLHPNGVSWEGPSAYISRKPQRNVSIMDLQQLISELNSDEAALFAIHKLEEKVRNVLLYSEGLMKEISSIQRTCVRCFQILEVAFVFSSSFHPFIIQVSPTTYTNGLSSLSSYLVEQRMLEDLATMLSTRGSTAKEVSVALAKFRMAFITYDKLCNRDNSFCLGKSQLTYLMDTRREHGATKNWRRLCPSTSSYCGVPSLSLSLLNLGASRHNWTNMNARDNPFDIRNERASNLKDEEFTADRNHSFFHKLVTAMEKLFLELDENIGLAEAQDLSENQQRSAINKQSFVSNISYIPSLISCDNDSSSMPHLSAIHFHPHLKMRPEFSPLTVEYQAYVPYDQLVISIRVRTKNCQASAVVDKIPITTGWTNLSMGLGENLIHIIVVDSCSTFNHWGLNAYKIRIHRIRNDHHLGGFHADKAIHQVCILKQDCLLQYSTKDRCGLQTSNYFASWNQYLHHRSSLPSCSSHNIDGHWVVPCPSCHDNGSCIWQKAIWQAYGCKEKTLTKTQLQRCFHNKKVLFIGDSTNRGILHYLIERLNDTLGQWDKTHNIKIYPSLNDGRTTLGFAYYPQFWLPLSRRPMLDTAVKKLIERISPVVNSSNTVIALGGVHWLEKHHLDILSSTLQRQGLSGAQVIVKGLGAGFHQPIESLRYLSLGDHEKLLEKNEILLSYAIRKGFQVFDTFKMTMARYKDFLQGKCSCHFQRVSERRIPFWSKLNHSIVSPFDIKSHFHVEGDIGAAYSEMFINRICQVRGYV